MDERAKDGDEAERDQPASPDRETAAIPLGTSANSDGGGSIVHWSAIEPGSELAATVLFAAGFAFDPERPVRESYRVQRKLGAGAMGQVLEVALVREQSQQHFALKLVARPRSSGRSSLGASSEMPTDSPTTQQDAATRWLTGLLRNEASKQEAAQRHGVTVARFVALVRLDDGALGLRMEMARGRSWGALVEEENLRRDDPPDIYRAIRATRKLLGQLRRVHSIREPGAPSGFVHSDIKPTNVFVEDADPTDPSVTLLDFGVATAGRAAFDDESALLGRETFVLRQTGGTPGYAPLGHFNARPSPASDVHAAMVCFYELVALSLPWDIDELDPSPAGFALLELRMSSPPRAVRSMRAAIPADEAKVLDRFFESAFAELQSRSLAWSAVASARDEASHERSRVMVDELSTLAGEYQRSLDALSRELESLGISAPPSPPPSLILTPAAPTSVVADEPAIAIDTAPTMVAAQGRPRPQRVGRHRVRRADRASARAAIVATLGALFPRPLRARSRGDLASLRAEVLQRDARCRRWCPSRRCPRARRARRSAHTGAGPWRLARRRADGPARCSRASSGVSQRARGGGDDRARRGSRRRAGQQRQRAVGDGPVRGERARRARRRPRRRPRSRGRALLDRRPVRPEHARVRGSRRDGRRGAARASCSALRRRRPLAHHRQALQRDERRTNVALHLLAPRARARRRSAHRRERDGRAEQRSRRCQRRITRLERSGRRERLCARAERAGRRVGSARARRAGRFARERRTRTRARRERQSRARTQARARARGRAALSVRSSRARAQSAVTTRGRTAKRSGGIAHGNASSLRSSQIDASGLTKHH
jgi:serine/threonine protein kinase